MRARLVLPVLVAASLLLSGCATDAFSEPQAAEDELPAGLDLQLDPASSRFAGEHDGIAVYIALRDDDPSSHCVAFGPVDELSQWSAGCSAGGWVESRNEVIDVSVRYERSGVADRDGWTRLGDYVLVR